MRCITGIGKDKGYFIENSRLRRNPKTTISGCGLQKRRLSSSPVRPHFKATLETENYRVKV
jgi:hypothetical protein